MRLVLGFPLLALAFAACAVPSSETDIEQHVSANVDPITDVDNSTVKNQSIGNCWIYATASWAESLNKTATGVESNFSESYWTYWHWFEQIANGRASSSVSTGGTYDTAAELMNRYGVMNEADFIPEEATAITSSRQRTALAAINTSLASGVLAAPAARRDRTIVRQELDAAFGLSPAVIGQMNAVFGADVGDTLDRSPIATRGTSIRRASDLPAMLHDPSSRAAVTKTLQDAIGTRAATGGRSGAFAWNTVGYPVNASARRTLQIRMQKALADSQPVILSWYVDFAAIDAVGEFLAPPATPGRQGGHMVVLEDYQVSNVPGFGTLPVGVLETRPEALAAALDPAATIDLLRIKNSWGSYHANPALPTMSGYHDLYLRYLDGPIKECQQNATDTGSTDQCWDGTPLQAFTLPPGY